jgi:hypothetical protein
MVGYLLHYEGGLASTSFIGWPVAVEESKSDQLCIVPSKGCAHSPSTGFKGLRVIGLVLSELGIVYDRHTSSRSPWIRCGKCTGLSEYSVDKIK